MTNAVFLDNEGRAGGGIRQYAKSSVEIDTTITNASFHGNTADLGPAFSASPGVTTKVRNSIIWGNSGDDGDQFLTTGTIVNHCIVDGGRPDGMEADDFIESFDANPNFVEEGNLRLLPDSPAIDAGNSFVSDLPDLDLDGNPRIVDGDGEGGEAIDIGAYEFQP